jgi:uncharacterized protein (DUF433 family)
MRSEREGRARRTKPPVIRTDIPSIDGAVSLSFLELMELRVVKAFIDKGLSLQHVRKAGALACRRFRTDHPFASRRVFTDGRNIFSAISDDVDSPDVVKWREAEIDQVTSGKLFERFLREIEFDERTSLAERWWPMGKGHPIVLDPQVSFGAPVIEGTAVRTVTIARYARRESFGSAAVAFEIERRQAKAAMEFEELLAAA